MRKYRLVWVFLSLGVLAKISVADEAFTTATMFDKTVNEAGEIRLPEDFRQSMVHLGSWWVPEGDAAGFHDVYADANGVAVYRQTGEFADGTVIVKEVRADAKDNFTTGTNVRYASQVKLWFVMVKDTKERFKGSKHWGNGWGWALIKPDNVSKNISQGHVQECQGCHLPAKATDWVYIQGYPTLTHQFKESSTQHNSNR